jgi:hypothetical protein
MRNRPNRLRKHTDESRNPTMPPPMRLEKTSNPAPIARKHGNNIIANSV